MSGRVLAPLVAAGLLGACATHSVEETILPEPEPVLVPGVIMSVERTGRDAALFVENVAAVCWLDHVIGGTSMIANRINRQFVIVGQNERIVVLDALDETSARWRLTGTVLADPATIARLKETLAEADRTGDVSCT